MEPTLKLWYESMFRYRPCNKRIPKTLVVKNSYYITTHVWIMIKVKSHCKIIKNDIIETFIIDVIFKRIVE